MVDWEIMYEQTITSLEHLVAKCVTVGATYLGGTQVFPVLLNYIFGLIGQAPIPANDVIYQLLYLGLAYAIWMQALIPWVSAWFASQQKGTAGMGQNYFRII